MDATQLRAHLGATSKELAAWVRKGLPCRGRGRDRRFDAEVVESWLVKKGLAAALDQRSELQPIAETLVAVAEHFAVSPRTVSDWRREWKAQGLAWSDGPYPLGEIAAWKTRREAEGGSRDQARLMRIRADAEQLEFDRKRGRLVDVETPAVLMNQMISLAASLLEQAPERLAAQLPQSIEAKQWPKVRGLIETKLRVIVDDIRSTMSSSLEEWAAWIEKHKQQ